MQCKMLLNHDKLIPKLLTLHTEIGVVYLSDLPRILSLILNLITHNNIGVTFIHLNHHIEESSRVTHRVTPLKGSPRRRN